MARFQRALVACLIVSLLLPVSFANFHTQPVTAASTYAITDLGTLGGSQVSVSAINDAGQIVGSSTLPGGTATHAFLWQNGSMTDLGVFAGESRSEATDINASGQIVGLSDVPGAYNSRAVLWQNGTVVDLGSGPLNNAYAESINDSGHVAGNAELCGGCYVGVLWQNGAMTGLPDLGFGGSDPSAINNAGQVVGRSYIFTGITIYTHAFLWQNGQITDLGAEIPNGYPFDSDARDINTHGQVVGDAYWPDAHTTHATLWQNGTAVDLGDGDTGPLYNNHAYGINDLGEIVGQGNSGAVAWKDGTYLDLNTLIPSGTGWRLQAALAINNVGQIVGQGTLNGQQRAFLLTPTTGNNLTPSITGLNPPSATAGGPGFTLTISGRNFAPDAIVYWQGETKQPTSVTSTRITVRVTASDIASSGEGEGAHITVKNPMSPTPSNTVTFHIGDSKQQSKQSALDDEEQTVLTDLAGEIPGVGQALCYFVDSAQGGFVDGVACVTVTTLDDLVPFLNELNSAMTAGRVVADIALVADPPDPNYTAIAQPTPPSINHVSAASGFGQAVANAFNALADNQAQQIGLKQAWLLSVEREEGAAAAGDTTWATRQGQAARNDAAQLVSLIGQEGQLWDNLATAIQQADPSQVITFTQDDLSAMQADVAANGLPADFVQALTQAGATSAMIDDLRQTIATADLTTIPSRSMLLQEESAAFTTFASDTTAPSVTCASPDGAWRATDVSISCTTRDLDSGLANPADASFSLTTSVPTGTETANAATNSRQVCDVAGNCATAGPVAGNKVDKKPPTITVTAPVSAKPYLLHQAVVVGYTCADGGSGLATCVGPVANGGALDTTSVSAKTFAVSATDQVGNAAKQVVPYTVTYNVCLLYDPTQAKKAGSDYPIKLQLCDAQGVNVSAADLAVTAVSIQGPDGATVPPTWAGDADPGGAFRFAGDRYTFNLKTTGLAPGTYTLNFTVAGDPVMHTAQFVVR